MNVTGPGIIDNVTKASLLVDVTSFMQDPDTQATVVLTTVDGPGFDPSTGVSAPVTTQVTTTGWLADLTLSDVEHSGGVYQIGDRRLVVPSADFTNAPEVGATLRDDSIRYAVVSAETDALEFFHVLVGRRTQ